MSRVYSILVMLVVCMNLAACGINVHDAAQMLHSSETEDGNTSGVEASRKTAADEEAPFFLEIDDPESGAQTFNFSICNKSGQDAQIFLIPTLEKRLESGGWEEIPVDDGIGFCGTPDPLPAGQKEWSEDISYLWGNLYAGEYRLSYAVTDRSGNAFAAAGCFTLAYDLVQTEREQTNS